MKAAVIYEPGVVRVADVPQPTPMAGEVLIKVVACGVCGSDNLLYTGGYYANYPVVLGHEFSGKIVEVGSGVQDLKTGDRVTVDPNVVCHKCNYCNMGSVHLCDNLKTLGFHVNGANAEYTVVPETNVYKIPDHISYEEAAFCEPLACVIRGFEVGPVQLGDTVLVLGAGAIGNLVMQTALHSGASTVIVSEPIEFRRKIALENGASQVVDPAKQDVRDEVSKVRKIGADVVFECSGNPAVITEAISSVRKGGTIVLFGVCPKGETIEVSPFDINENEIKITGSFNNPNTQSQALKLLANRTICVEQLVTNRVPLEQYPEVFGIFGGSETLKTMVVMEN